MKNLIIGSSGFLGKELTIFLRNLGEEVVEFDIKNGKHEDARVIDLPLDGIDRVYFLAWDVGGSKFLYKESSQLTQMKWNNDLINKVFPQIIDMPFIFISSQLADKTDTVYGVQKQMGEVWTKLSTQGVTVRLWNIYGYNESFTERSHVVSDFVHQAVIDGEINMLTKGKEFRQYIHIDDVCDGLVKAFDIEDKSKTYDISSGQWVELLELANIISEETKCKVNPGEKHGDSLLIDNKEFVPNWEANVSLEEGIKRMVKSFKDES
jgi:nucleoside-diphosphate-sugar epimerase